MSHLAEREARSPLAQRAGERLADLAERLRERFAFADAEVDRSVRWRTAVPVIALVFVAARLLAVVAALVGEWLRPDPPHWLVTTTEPIVRSLTSWDVVHYVSIATNGYTTQLMQADRPFPEYVFFPLLPALMATLHAATGIALPLAALLIGNVGFALGLAVVYALGARHVGHRRALIGTAFIALAPGAAAFTMGYSDGLYLLASAGAFLAVEERRDRLAALAYAAATLSRLPGVTLGLPLVLLLIAQDGPRPTRRWLLLAAGPAALAAFYGYLGILTGDPLANLHGQSAWNVRSLPAGMSPVIAAAAIAIFVAMIGVLVASTVVVMRARRDQVPPVYAVYAAIGIAVIIGSLRLVSMTRYLAVLFPVAWALASHRHWRLVLSGSALLYLILAAAAFGPGPAP